MPKSYNLDRLGLSDYAVHTYLSLLMHHPVNGSQLSKRSGIPRARIYDVLHTLKKKGMVNEVGKGRYVPLPPDELIKQLRRSHEKDLGRLQDLIDEIQAPDDHDYIWSITGYQRIMDKAREMIDAARHEIYIRLFPQDAKTLIPALEKAERRSVAVRCIFMGTYPKTFAIQVVHPQHEMLMRKLKGRSFDLVVDREEFIGGLIDPATIEESRINWGRNRWFVVSGRDSLRHDFFHYFLFKTQTLGQPLDEDEKRIYEIIQNDL